TVGAVSDEGALTGAAKGAAAGGLQGIIQGAERVYRLAHGRRLLQPDDVAAITGTAQDIAPSVLHDVTQGQPAGTVQRFKQLLGTLGEDRASATFRSQTQLAIAGAGGHVQIPSPTYAELLGAPPGATVGADE